MSKLSDEEKNLLATFLGWDLVNVGRSSSGDQLNCEVTVKGARSTTLHVVEAGDYWTHPFIFKGAKRSLKRSCFPRVSSIEVDSLDLVNESLASHVQVRSMWRPDLCSNQARMLVHHIRSKGLSMKFVRLLKQVKHFSIIDLVSIPPSVISDVVLRCVEDG